MTNATTRFDLQHGTRRKTFAAGLVVLSALLSGCAAYPFVGPSCGPGETDIAAVDGNVSEVKVKGELTAVNQSRMVLDDGTGQATVSLTDLDPSEVSTGDCIIVLGQATESKNDARDTEMLPSVIWREEITIEE